MGNMEEIKKEVTAEQSKLTAAEKAKQDEANQEKRKFDSYGGGQHLENARNYTRQAEELREEANKLDEAYNALEASVTELQKAVGGLSLKPEEEKQAKAEIEEALAVLLGKLRDCQGQAQSTVEATRTHLADQLGPIIKKGPSAYPKPLFGLIGASQVKKWKEDLVKTNNKLGNWLNGVASECHNKANEVRTAAATIEAQSEGTAVIAEAQDKPITAAEAIERRREVLGL